MNEAENEALPEVKEGTTRYPTRARNKPSYLSEYVVESVVDNSISHAVDDCFRMRDASISYSEAVSSQRRQIGKGLWMIRVLLHLSRATRDQLEEHWASIPKVVGSIPTAARQTFQPCPVWIYTQSNITNIIFTSVHNTNTDKNHVHHYCNLGG